jgi:sugar phosphate isomerase/epimerase
MDLGVICRLTAEGNPFNVVAANGMKTAQLVNWNIRMLTDELAEKTVADLKESGIRLAAYWAGYSGRVVWNAVDGPVTCGLVPADLRAKRVEDLKRGADFAKKIGAPAIVTHCGFIPESPRSREYVETVNAIYEVAAYCCALGLDFWFESGQETPLTLLRTIEDLRLPNLGVNLDTANMILYGRGNPVDALDVFGPWVRNLHIKDGVFSTNASSLGHETAVGEGKVDFEKVIRKLYALGFDGELIIEREISGPRQLRDIIRARDYIQALVDICRPLE